jgi:hypothetical protein
LNTTAGVLLVLVDGVAEVAEPKFQVQEVAPVPASENETASGAQPDNGLPFILATGACAITALPTVSRHRMRISFLFNGFGFKLVGFTGFSRFWTTAD